MEQVHGVDVSWMTQASPKDRIAKKPPSPPTKTPGPAPPRQAIGTHAPKPTSADASAPSGNDTHQSSNGHHTSPANAPPSNGPQPIPTRRRARSTSVDKNPSPGSPSLSRRNSWFSNFSAKFSAHPENHAAANQQEAPADVPEEEEAKDSVPPPPVPTYYPSPPKTGGGRGAVLPPGSRPTGNGPYTPAPPKSGQAGFLGVFRRLSSSGGNHHATKMGNGLVERKVLNVDENRQRCTISELKDSNLRKVSFFVDVEIAPMPKYADAEAHEKSTIDSGQKKITEKGEGEVLKNPKAFEDETEPPAGVTVTSTEQAGSPTTRAPIETANDAPKSAPAATDGGDESAPPENNKKKEKKRRSEEERKARKERKRKLAEANGSVPLEIRYESSGDSDKESKQSDESPRGSPKAPSTRPSFPPTDPVRIYRRCCQLRETPILKKITEQLLDTSNLSSDTGMVNRLDLTGYWLQQADAVTLGDYLAVVPVREVLLENSDLNDEGLRVILAGLLAARQRHMRFRKPKHGLEPEGGLVERLVVRNNKFGPDGWKHLSLFIYRCRSLKYLDVSQIQFPRQATCHTNGTLPDGRHVPRGIAEVFSKALSERLAGTQLELLNIGSTEPTMDQLGTIVDGLVKVGARRLNLAHNHLDDQGVEHLGRFLASGKYEGLDLSGNDLRDRMEPIVSAVSQTDSLWALSLSGCNLTTSSLCKLLPALAKLTNFRFIDLSHNHELFQSSPSAVGPLRRFLPKMEPLKRIHLQDVDMSPEQAIALAEVLPEIRSLAHVSFLGNSHLVELSDARTEEAQEEACALYASLMAAARLSKSLVCVDIEVPSKRSGELVKAMAKQVVAYCLRNMENLPDSDIGAAVASAMSEVHAADNGDSKTPGYPDVLAHLVGHDVLDQSEPLSGDQDAGPDEDYVIGGTGVVKALACCLKNRSDDAGGQSGELSPDRENGDLATSPNLAAGGKAKDMSKHLLAGARKIRYRLQPALIKARENPSDEISLRKLVFLDDTLQGIIKRFEDEFPDTREDTPGISVQPPAAADRVEEPLSSSLPAEDVAVASDGEDESKIHPPRPLSRSSSVLSKRLAEEEGRILRAGHRFRSGFFTQENIGLLASIDDISTDEKHAKMLASMAEDIGGPLLELVKEKGAVRTFKEDREQVLRWMKEADPDYWDNFIEAQRKARANISVSTGGKDGDAPQSDDSAIAD